MKIRSCLAVALKAKAGLIRVNLFINMNLFIGIGNPSPEYDGTRHNIGKFVVSELAQEFNTGLEQKPDLSAEIGIFENKNSEKIILANSLTYMNDSRWAVKAIANFYKIPPENIWVIHDEFDIPIGEIKESFNSSSAGHNGIKSIIQELGTQKFHRLRIGIHPAEETPIPLEKFVLEKFTEDELPQTKKALEEALKKIKLIIDNCFYSSALEKPDKNLIRN